MSEYTTNTPIVQSITNTTTTDVEFWKDPVGWIGNKFEVDNNIKYYAIFGAFLLVIIVIILVYFCLCIKNNCPYIWKHCCCCISSYRCCSGKDEGNDLVGPVIDQPRTPSVISGGNSGRVSGRSPVPPYTPQMLPPNRREQDHSISVSGSNHNQRISPPLISIHEYPDEADRTYPFSNDPNSFSVPANEYFKVTHHDHPAFSGGGGHSSYKDPRQPRSNSARFINNGRHSEQPIAKPRNYSVGNQPVFYSSHNQLPSRSSTRLPSFNRSGDMDGPSTSRVEQVMEKYGNGSRRFVNQ